LGRSWGSRVRHCSTAPVMDKYTESLVRFAEKVGKPPVRLAGIRYDGTIKRFYQKVDVEETPEGFAPTVGGRFLQTANGFLVEVPSRLLATSLALEWDYQVKFIKPHLMPLMHFTTQAIDQVPTKRHDLLRNVMAYIDFDSACVRDFHIAALSRAQEKYLTPVVAWFEERFGVKLSVGIEEQLTIDPIRQSPEVRAAIEARLCELTDWEYTVFDQCCSISKSIIISLAVVEGQLDLNRAFECARLEENYAMRKNGQIGGAFGHGIDVEFAKHRLAAARTFINMINVEGSGYPTLSQRNSYRNPPPKPQGKTLAKLREEGEDSAESLTFI